jgi:hypothetical protein
VLLTIGVSGVGAVSLWGRRHRQLEGHSRVKLSGNDRIGVRLARSLMQARQRANGCHLGLQ